MTKEFITGLLLGLWAATAIMGSLFSWALLAVMKTKRKAK